jgi:tetratricopeptide (TPR) repeat protein
MAVFGLPAVHEDDPLRAVRAAQEMQAEMGTIASELEAAHGTGLSARIGINTGEVVAGDATTGQRLVTGDAVNVAARLEQAASPGTILLSSTTARLVRDAVVVEALDRLELKGKSEPVEAFRLVEVRGDTQGHARALDSPMVGRDKELQLLRQALERATTERTSQLFTLLGSAGVGKSRLVHEFLTTSTEGVRVLRGRCLSYGDGVTYYAIGEIVHQAAGITDTDSADVAAAKVRDLVGDADDGERIASLIAGALGWSGAAAPEDAAWAFRKLLEHLAGDHTVVVEIDDIHWAEPLLLDLIDHLADWTRDAPVLIVCVARPELLELRPGWGGGKLNATSMLLEPLGGEEAAVMLRNLLGEDALPPAATDRILVAAEGNPLFVEEMVGMLIDDGLLQPTGTDGRWNAVDDLADLTVPPTIQLLLAARLDRLDAEERVVIERGAVEGKIFHVGAVTSLTPESIRPRVRPRLLQLARKELIRPDRAEFAGEDAFRFRHLLIRDAAYQAMPKEQRSQLHEAFAEWLAGVAGTGTESYDEILAFHLEQAYRYRAELGLIDDRARELGNRASAQLQMAAEQLLARGDLDTAISLLQRAADVATVGAIRDAATTTLAETHYLNGEAAPALDTATSTLARGEDLAPRLRVHNAITAALARIAIDPEQQLLSDAEADDLLRVAEATGDDHVIARCLLMRAQMEFWRGHCAAARTIAEQLRPRASSLRAMLRRQLALMFGSDLVFGSATPDEAGEIIDIGRSLMGDSLMGRITELHLTAIVHAYRDEPAEFDATATELDRIWEDMGDPGHRFIYGQGLAEALRWLGRFDEAKVELGRTKERLDAQGETSFNSTITALLAVIECERGHDEEAAAFLREAWPMTSEDDFAAQAQCRWTDAWLAAKQGRHAEAIATLDEALAVLEGSDYLNMHADTHRYRGEVFRLADDGERAQAAFAHAFELWDRKGNEAAARTLRDRLA